METILIIAGISLVAALALIGYVNYKSHQREDEMNLNIQIGKKTQYSSLEYNLIHLIDMYICGIKLNNIISTVCQEHSLSMARVGKADHHNALLRGNKLKKALGIKSSGEIVAYGQATAKGILKMWLKSPKHKAILDRGDWKKFGLSIEKNKRNYTTCIFTK